MHYNMKPFRVNELKSVMQTWVHYFEAKNCLPTKEDLDALKKKSKPTDELPLRWEARQHADDSTDEEADAKA